MKGSILKAHLECCCATAQCCCTFHCPNKAKTWCEGHQGGFIVFPLVEAMKIQKCTSFVLLWAIERWQRSSFEGPRGWARKCHFWDISRCGPLLVPHISKTCMASMQVGSGVTVASSSARVSEPMEQIGPDFLARSNELIVASGPV